VPSSDDFIVSEPSSAHDFELYYALRFEVLRKPWGHARGSERDETDSSSIHAFVKKDDKAWAVARLHFVDAEAGQIRYMGVHPGQHGKGLGKKVIRYLEEKAIENGRKKMILHARINAVKFYESCGYRLKEKSYLLWGKIPHWLMERDL
jgi:GNAT superfamily N-acetyltransferase